MGFTYKEIQDEVKRRATRDQAGTQFDVAIKNVINTSLLRINRENLWRNMRRTTKISTVTSYTTGSGAVSVTNGSKNVTITGATLLTDNIQINRYIKFSGSAQYFKVVTITGETTLTIDIDFDGTTSTSNTYSIFPQCEYNLPPQVTHRCFIWHRNYGYPYQLSYATEQEFYMSGCQDVTTGVPTYYRMWSTDMVKNQLKSSSVIRIQSSSTLDTNKKVIVYGLINGLPESETIITNSGDGTTPVSGLKTFDAGSIERIGKNTSTKGQITVDANSGNTILTIIPSGNSTSGVQYNKISIQPLPNSVFDLNISYYKQPYSLVDDEDFHEFGQEFDEAIILISTAKINYESSKSEGDRFYQLYKDEIRNLKKVNTDKLDWFPDLLRPGQMNRPGGFSPVQAGSYYGWGSTF